MQGFLGVLEKIRLAIASLNLNSVSFLSDILDILLVTFIIYEGIKIIRGSRTLQVVKGIVFLGVAYFAVKLLNMEASEYLLSVLFENAIIILVVLFSPELRNVLERFGRRSIRNISIFNFRNTAEYDKTVTTAVNEFCKAVNDMSDTKTGALVVFERVSPLQEIIDSGTVLDAQASQQLFNSLFFKNSALHDGAVVVRDGRIYAAGCILPLTHDNSIESDLGTRHRAAIGMSEQSDAILVVVSEETGDVSFAREGKLTRDVQTAVLREVLLESLMTDKDTSKQKTKKFFKSKKSDGGDKNEK